MSLSFLTLNSIRIQLMQSRGTHCVHNDSGEGLDLIAWLTESLDLIAWLTESLDLTACLKEVWKSRVRN